MKLAVLSLILLLAGCAAKRPVENDIMRGQFGKAVFDDCRVKVKLGKVHCDCQDFDMSVDAKSGVTHFRCQNVSH